MSFIWNNGFLGILFPWYAQWIWISYKSESLCRAILICMIFKFPGLLKIYVDGNWQPSLSIIQFHHLPLIFSIYIFHLSNLCFLMCFILNIYRTYISFLLLRPRCYQFLPLLTDGVSPLWWQWFWTGANENPPLANCMQLESLDTN